ncbi:MAG: putative ABC transport system ATP-binding protein [Pseudohongiellaceae bacterium]|jgi:putative ABC transport system ATP-binding protein
MSSTSGQGAADSAPHPAARLWALLAPDRKDVLVVVAFSVAIGVMLLATPVAVQALVNFVALGGALPPLFVVAFLLSLGLGFAATLTALQTWTVELLQRRLFVRLVADMATRLPRVDQHAWDGRNGPEMLNRFFDVVTIQKTGSFLLLDGLSILLSVTVGLVVLAFYHPLLLAFDLVLIVVIAVLVLGPLRKGTVTAIGESKAKYAMVALLQEVTRHPAAFKVGHSQQWVAARADALANAWVGKRRAHYRVVFGQVLGVLGLQVVASVVLLVIGGLLVMQGALTLGQLVAAELIVTLVVNSVAKLGKHLEGYYDLMAATEKVGHLLDLPTEPEPELAPAAQVVRAFGGMALDVRAVGWSPDGGRELISGVTFHVPAGGSVGVTGPSGSGKSVLLDLLWGLRRPTSGVVRLDGSDLRDVSPSSYRGDVAIVGPLSDVLQTSVRDNVAMGRQDIDDERVRQVLDMVGLAHTVAALPEAVHSVLGPYGWPLSGGQVRRLLLARALASQPRLLLVHDVLDEVNPALRGELLDVLSAADATWTLVVASCRDDVLTRCKQQLTLRGDGLVTPAVLAHQAPAEPDFGDGGGAP